jgi:hypothetical protein
VGFVSVLALDVRCQSSADHARDRTVVAAGEFDQLPPLLGLDVSADVCSLCNLVHPHASYVHLKFCK